jgi:chemotaxis protein methyltransferase CheR
MDAFDINPEVIDAAKKGRYTANALREDGSAWKFLLDLYLRPADQDFEIIEILRDKVKFFTHNIMEKISGYYDIIFFRNALIYFSPENRRSILNTLIAALNEGGVLIVGVSETASVADSRLEMVHRMGAFYFKKLSSAAPQPVSITPAVVPLPPSFVSPAEAVPQAPVKGTENPPIAAVAPQRDMPVITPVEVARLLEHEEGIPNARRVLMGIETAAADFNGNELAAAVLCLLSTGDFPSAGLVLSCLESRAAFPVVSFLRGEFYYHTKVDGEANTAAEGKYQEAIAGDSSFWPAFYRVSSLAEEGNRIRYEYRLKKALESMGKGSGKGYEIFIGGFSPDYYRRILEKKLAE